MRGVENIQPRRISRGSSIVMNASGSQRSTSRNTTRIWRRATTVCMTSTGPVRPCPVYAVTPQPSARSASARPAPMRIVMTCIVAMPIASFSSSQRPTLVPAAKPSE